ncbi:MAG: hypothetical protein AB7G06_06715 [Bdellovibrionales bacterium]
MIRFRPSAGSILCVLLILLAVGLELFVLTPLYNRTFERHRELKDRLKTIEAQQNTAQDDTANLQQRLARAAADDQTLLAEMNRFRNTAQLENAAYSLGAWQETLVNDQTFYAQRLELDLTAARDASIWQFLNMATAQSMYWAQLERLHVAHEIRDANTTLVHAVATIVFYRMTP